MAVSDWSSYQAKVRIPFQRVTAYAQQFSDTTAGVWSSLWTKMLPTPGVAPGAAVSPARTLAGALGQRNGNQRLTRISGGMGTTGVLMIYDRLVHCSGLSGTVLTAQNTSMSGLLPSRAGSGADVLAALEIYTAIGSGTTVTCGYTSSAGANQTSPAMEFGGSQKGSIAKFLPIPLASGDAGVQSVNSVLLATTTGTAGNFGVTLYKPLAMVPLLCWGNEPRVFDSMLDLCCHVPLVPNDACLALCAMPYQHNAMFNDILFDFEFIED